MREVYPERLSGIDAMFLYLEDETQVMNVGAVCIFEGRVTRPQLLRHLDSRVHLIPRYRQRLVFSPLNLTHPAWEDDPDFDLHHHILQHTLRPPGGEVQLRRLAGKIFGEIFDRGRPPWEIHLVKGLEGQGSALILKTHHCMLDGVAGFGLAKILFDTTPTVPKMVPPAYEPRAPRSGAVRFREALCDQVASRIEHWTRLQSGMLSFVGGLSLKEAQDAGQEFLHTMGRFLLPLHRLTFNRGLSPGRRMTWRAFPLAEARAFRALCGGTLNDIALTLVSGAIRRHLGEARARAWNHMRVLVPVNMREEGEVGALGNHISFLPVEIPVAIAEPVERLHAIHRTMQRLKEARVAAGVALLFESMQALPAASQALGLGLLRTPGIQGGLGHLTVIPPANLVCTNVPGPTVPLFLLGHRMTALYPTLPVCLGMGVAIAVTSYCDKFIFTLTGDATAARDVAHLAAALEQEYAELRAGTAARAAEYERLRAAVSPPPGTPARASRRRRQHGDTA